ncbi:riboflavin synthase [Patescibacteria group bacterium]|nr:riboflavin synthase [Patescibacteria group bacterium]MBU1890048.1 riboflavin synthase [Patescibacteria group bacterium]
MFSGIIYEIGTIKEIKKRKKAWSYYIQAKKSLSRMKVGSSIAVNGACLTVTKKTPKGFWIDMVAETMRKTYFNKCKVGARVNLEPSLRPFDELGGHLVQGHIDGVGKITDIFDTKHDLIYTIELPKKLMRYVANKGFIAVDGVSLTGLNPDTIMFQVAIIPHTNKHTTFQYKKKGDPVNIEVDMMAKYLERLLPKK